MSDAPLPIDRKAARFLADVAEALSELPDGEAIYVSEVRFGYDGSDTGYRVIPDEFGGYEITATTPIQDEPKDKKP